MRLFYTEEKELQCLDNNTDIEETTGWKNITVYDFDIQYLDLVVVAELRIKNGQDSEFKIKEELVMMKYPDLNEILLKKL